MSKNWSREELKASVKAYLEMRNLSASGETFKKRQFYTALSQRFGRTEKAFEYRMQNISFVLSIAGRSWLDGLKPARNVGANVAKEIEEIIAEVEGQKLSSNAEFETTVSSKRSIEKIAKPEGNPRPKGKK